MAFLGTAKKVSLGYTSPQRQGQQRHQPCLWLPEEGVAQDHPDLYPLDGSIPSLDNVVQPFVMSRKFQAVPAHVDTSRRDADLRDG